MAQPKDIKSPLEEWFELRDYEAPINTLSVGSYLQEIEMRLSLWEHALVNQGKVSNDIRWKQLKSSVQLGHLDISTRLYNGSGIQVLRVDELQLFAKRPHEELTGDTLEEWNQATRANQQSLKIQEYSPISPNEQLNVAMLADLNKSDKQLMVEFLAALGKARQYLKIDSVSDKKNYPKLKSIISHLKHRALQYLDILLYMLIEDGVMTPTKQHKIIAKTLDETDVGADVIKARTRDYYKPKLLDTKWMNEHFTNIRSTPSDLSLPVHIIPEL
ncbi:hypothetical protein ACPV56_09380 [Vibrio astriarenae]